MGNTKPVFGHGRETMSITAGAGDGATDSARTRAGLAASEIRTASECEVRAVGPSTDRFIG
jgi:hypothetical protein